MILTAFIYNGDDESGEPSGEINPMTGEVIQDSTSAVRAKCRLTNTASHGNYIDDVGGSQIDFENQFGHFEVGTKVSKGDYVHIVNEATGEDYGTFTVSKILRTTYETCVHTALTKEKQP